VAQTNSCSKALERSVLDPKTVEQENGKFNQNEGNFKKNIIQILESLRRRGMSSSTRGRQLLIACGKSTELRQRTNVNTPVAAAAVLYITQTSCLGKVWITVQTLDTVQQSMTTTIADKTELRWRSNGGKYYQPPEMCFRVVSHGVPTFWGKPLPGRATSFETYLHTQSYMMSKYQNDAVWA
jgi:hypothetical protein